MVRRAAGLLIGCFACVVSLAACAGRVETQGDEMSSGGKQPSTSPTGTPAPAQCSAYASTWCNKAFGCYVKEGRLDQGSLKYNVDQCKKLIVERLPCSEVTSVTADYSKCIADIKAMSCSRWNVPQEQFATILPPTICNEVLSFE
jgi:hypothetical protein